MIWTIHIVALLCSLLGLRPCAGEVPRQGAFITYSEVSRSRDELDPGSIAAVALVSTYGQIRLRLRRDWAPKACEAIAAMAVGTSRECSGCSFYRHEPVPLNWGVNGFSGPPYALLQGGLPGMLSKVKMENAKLLPVIWAWKLGMEQVMQIGRGTAAFIGDTSDFFIGTADHTEWGGAFTVFAEVVAEDMAGVVSNIPVEPYRNSTDSYNITTRWLLQSIPFTLQPLRLDELSTGAV
ncbi:hypothetical protein VOLCADRAFT_106423 [Volvox carteri f. nagariensis]|uniref:Uncharacterized protein n=1 Tax=Volvox carteri f. nagariensis TaxID=3068 RepID=D8U788_VOLCA|nr:uncharacterized protein VOLCADRAFT_106423 [Volvox carteri f. nagariensis]EFJ44380.1 hypothetical protein VOLCADRAFT_106423 [Volvox carteri f. nagariensis]|eukprot:XP_002954487.1 hypothetical protein VOLCADRAFT_106423 [Volvox carteri f. nagariensis]